jgi:uncharacterized membrane protein YeaQ/YmgE (transglycosylase-associated protein family)
MDKEFSISMEMMLSGFVGAVIGSWTTVLYDKFSIAGFCWVIAGGIILIGAMHIILTALRHKRTG